MIKPLLALMLSSTFLSLSAQAETPPAKSLAPDRLAINGGQATLALSQDWVRPKPQIQRAVIMVHGRQRNAPTYLRTIERAANIAKERNRTLLIAPQFLDDKDVAAHHLGDNILRWHEDDWMAGNRSLEGKGISSFTVLDHIIRRLSDPKLFPNLKEIVVAGHSGGAQMVQRYAVLGGREEARLKQENIRLRYVVATPSTYAWFDAQRPVASPEKNCPGFNDWKYGLNKLPPYAEKFDKAGLEKAYVQRDVTYLLALQDNDPNHPALDKSCAAEAQGADRLSRGQNYFDYLTKRHPEGLNQRVVQVPKVAHNGDALFSSPEGQAVLFKPL
ncbi:alpha/beta hydrolase [uncultured Pseudomonas sp.]|uniref:alpha/beta hydrolase n=1 Tax=uncultured Pseudomonas sp. TaxID=114707 RepID=UPI0025D17537|nr:alpha/beta hydrolase [uncultured Pseudomonas sp.]